MATSYFTKMENLLLGLSRRGIGVGVGVDIFRPESESLKICRFRSPDKLGGGSRMDGKIEGREGRKETTT